ncbi:PDDEXK nuclease domain-containing protein [Sanguibacter sp. 25GB23B1]|uniref:PDDEXK nuclease domain-containing protein n=1 Tax=unclassified Sanguibacter TaxID=2645534 RepID=UPI0032AF6C86
MVSNGAGESDRVRPPSPDRCRSLELRRPPPTGRLRARSTAHVGQLGTYVALVDDRLRRADRHAHTLGILLCAGRNEAIVHYALAGASAPLAVAGYTYKSLPLSEQAALPAAEDLEAILTQATEGGPRDEN